MRVNRLQAKLEAGDTVTGLFAPVGAEFETPGVLSWTAERGAQLDLADLTDAWPDDFDARFTVHGVVHWNGELVTLMEARVNHLTAVTATRVAASTLAIGEHTDLHETWTYADYAPPGLHEWNPENGLSISHPDDDIDQVQVTWRPVAPVIVSLPDAELTLRLARDYSWSGPASPDWSIASIDAVCRKAGYPHDDQRLLARITVRCSALFAADRPEEFAEVFSSPSAKSDDVVLRQGHRPRYDRG